MSSSALSRIGVWFLLAGGLVAIRAFIELSGPVYWQPATLLDYSAVILTTVAWVVTGVALLSWWRSSPLRRGSVLLALGGVGTLLSGVGNLLEDVFDVGFGEFLFNYPGMIGAVGILVGALGVLTVKDSLRWVGLGLLAFIAGAIFDGSGGQALSGQGLLFVAVWLIRSPRGRGGSIPGAAT